MNKEAFFKISEKSINDILIAKNRDDLKSAIDETYGAFSDIVIQNSKNMTPEDLDNRFSITKIASSYRISAIDVNEKIDIAKVHAMDTVRILTKYITELELQEWA